MKKELFILAGLIAIFSFALVSTAQAGTLTNASATPAATNYGGRLTNYEVSFTLATQIQNGGQVHLIFPSGFGLPGANGAVYSTSTTSASAGLNGILASATVTADSVVLEIGGGAGEVGASASDVLHITGIGPFLNPYDGGSLTLGIETRTSANAVIDNASTTAFTIVGADPERDKQVVPTTKTVAPPSSKITSPTVGQSIAAGQNYVIKGTASDQGLYAVSKVEVSVDGGSTWMSASLTKVSASNFTWEYTWTSPAAGSYTIKSRATDTNGNVESPGTGVTLDISLVTPATPAPTPTPTPTPPAPEKPISEMTAPELQARITQLQQQLISLLQKLASLLTQQLQGLSGAGS